MIPASFHRFRGVASLGLSSILLWSSGTLQAQYHVDPSQWQVYLKQAERGDVMAQIRMGYLHEKGLGVAQDWTKACQWYRTAAEQGERQGQTDYGRCFSQGLGGVPADPSAAVSWWTKAAIAGSPTGHQELGVALAQGRGVPIDIPAAIAHLRIAALAGLDASQGALGILLNEGKGIKQDRGQARYWLKQSAQSGNGGAAAYLAKMGPATEQESAAESAYASQIKAEKAAAYIQSRLQDATAKCASNDNPCWIRQSKAIHEINLERNEQRQKAQAANAAAEAAAAQARQAAERAAATPATVVQDLGADNIVLGIAFDAPLELPECPANPREMPDPACTVPLLTLPDGSRTVMVFLRENLMPEWMAAPALTVDVANGSVGRMAFGVKNPERFRVELDKRFGPPTGRQPIDDGLLRFRDGLWAGMDSKAGDRVLILSDKYVRELKSPGKARLPGTPSTSPNASKKS